MLILLGFIFIATFDMRKNNIYIFPQFPSEIKFDVMTTQRLTAEGAVSPGADVDTTVLTLVDVRFNCLTQGRVRATQRTQIEYTVFEEILYIHTKLQ